MRGIIVAVPQDIRNTDSPFRTVLSQDVANENSESKLFAFCGRLECRSTNCELWDCQYNKTTWITAPDPRFTNQKTIYCDHMLIDTLSLSLHLSPCPSPVEVYGLGASVVVAAGHLLRMRKWVSTLAQTSHRTLH